MVKWSRKTGLFIERHLGMDSELKSFIRIYHRLSLGNNRAVCQTDGSPGLFVILYEFSQAVFRLLSFGASDLVF